MLLGIAIFVCLIGGYVLGWIHGRERGEDDMWWQEARRRDDQSRETSV